MLDNQPVPQQQAFAEAFDNIIRALRQGADQDVIETLLRNAGAQLTEEKPIHLEDVANELKLDYQATVHLLHNKRPASEIILAAIVDWVQAKRLVAPGITISLEVEPSSEEEFIQIPYKKEYLKKDNDTILHFLEKEFTGQDLTKSKTNYDLNAIRGKTINVTYAWKYATGQEILRHHGHDGNSLNLFFLGTSTPPLFGIHNIDVCETGHIISQASLQKGLKKEPTLLVKGIGTVDMQPDFPMLAMQDPNIQGVSTGGFVESLRKTKTTVKGVGAQSRLQLTMDEFFVPNLLQMIINEPLESRGNLIVNITGHSRGGITSFIMADCAAKFIRMLAEGEEGIDYNVETLAASTKMGVGSLRNAIGNIKANTDKVQIHVCALDPVEGARSMTDWDPLGDYIPKFSVPVQGLTAPIECSYVSMPPAVTQAKIFFASDERRSGFRPTIPSFADTTKVELMRIPGKHGSLTGNFGNDVGNGQFAYPSLEHDETFQDALVGIFDQTLIEMNKAMNSEQNLPPFPLNTFRRIFRQPEYQGTFHLLYQGVLKLFPEESSQETIMEDELIALMLAMMTSYPQHNVVIYDALARDARVAIENHKLKLLSLQKEWRHDTNIGAMFDRDPWQGERTVYIRGKKLRGDIIWHDHSLESLVPTLLPDELYYGRTFQPVPYAFGKNETDPLAIQFYQFKNKIASLAQTYQLTNEQVKNSVFDTDFVTFSTAIEEALQHPDNQEFVINLLRELIIDMDYKYHMVPANEFVAQLAQFCSHPLVREMPQDCARLQMRAIETFVQTKGIHYLSTEEASKLITQIDEFISRLENADADHEHLIGLERGEREFYIEQLFELKEKCRVMVELDKYLIGIEVYMETKPRVTGQTVDEPQAFRQQLINIRAGMNNMPSQAARIELEELLQNYYGTKKHQGSFRFWRNREPGSIMALKKVGEQIDNQMIYKEMERIANRERERILKQDLDKFISELDGYLGSFRIFHLRKPDPSTGVLREKLNDIRSKLAEQSIERSVFEMKQLIEEYIEDRHAKFSLAGLVLDAGTVSALKKAAFERKAEEFAIAKEHVEAAGKMLSIKRY